MGISGSGERDEDLARAYVERLEAALAAAAHERDLAEERARLAGEGVEQLEERVGVLRQQRDRERDEADRERARDLAEVEERLEAHEKHLANAKAGIEARDRRLEAADEKLEARDTELSARREELKELDAALAAQRTEAAAVRARLELREEELKRSQTTADETQAELRATRERLGESERELAVRERDLAARVRELGQAGEELVARERELDLAEERLAELQGELDAAGVLLETRGAQLARAEEGARAATHSRDEARTHLEAREQHLKTAQLGVESRDRRLELTGRKLEAAEGILRSRDRELERLHAAERDRERKLVLAEARLGKAQQRAEYFQGSLVDIRSGRAYRLMRVLWRLRRPFRRAPREGAAADAERSDDVEPAPPSRRVSHSDRVAAPMRHRGERLRVASILDEMSAACFAPECDLVPLSLDGWREQLDERPPDLLLVESAWNGNGGEWQYRIAQYPRPDLAGLPALHALLDGCRERGIPTAFWNKEDPVHFERFSEAAALFDHVFTTDARCVERYRALPGERTVASLPFAAQPRIHNPVAAVAERSASPCFAGAWYRDRHPDRRRSLEALLDAARPHGLVIYDRRFGAEDAAFGFPERFAPHILGKLPYERILDVYKGHRVFLNANSVVDSPTMCSRRVFELAACDTAIVSTPGAALSALLGEGTVAEADSEDAAATALERLLADEAERRRRVRTARRKVFAEHTYAHRLATIAEAAGVDASSLRRGPIGEGHPWQLHLQPGTSLAAPALSDLAAAATFADADVIGAHPGNGTPAVEHRQVDVLDPRVLLMRRELIESRGRPTGSPEQVHAQLREWSDEGVRLYAADADLLVS